MENKLQKLTSVAPAALLALLGSQVGAGSFDSTPVIEFFG